EVDTRLPTAGRYRPGSVGRQPPEQDDDQGGQGCQAQHDQELAVHWSSERPASPATPASVAVAHVTTTSPSASTRAAPPPGRARVTIRPAGTSSPASGSPLGSTREALMSISPGLKTWTRVAPRSPAPGSSQVGPGAGTPGIMARTASPRRVRTAATGPAATTRTVPGPSSRSATGITV